MLPTKAHRGDGYPSATLFDQLFSARPSLLDPFDDIKEPLMFVRFQRLATLEASACRSSLACRAP